MHRFTLNFKMLLTIVYGVFKNLNNFVSILNLNSLIELKNKNVSLTLINGNMMHLKFNV